MVNVEILTLDNIFLIVYITYYNKGGNCMKQLKCLRLKCGHTWWPRNPDVKPRMCPACKSRLWDKKEEPK